MSAGRAVCASEEAVCCFTRQPATFNDRQVHVPGAGRLDPDGQASGQSIQELRERQFAFPGEIPPPSRLLLERIGTVRDGTASVGELTVGEAAGIELMNMVGSTSRAREVQRVDQDLSVRLVGLANELRGG